MGKHLVDGKFQSDRSPETPPNHMLVDFDDKLAQPALWALAEAYRETDPEFADDVELALRIAGFKPPAAAGVGDVTVGEIATGVANTASAVAGHASRLWGKAVDWANRDKSGPDGGHPA